MTVSQSQEHKSGGKGEVGIHLVHAAVGSYQRAEAQTPRTLTAATPTYMMKPVTASLHSDLGRIGLKLA